MEMCRVRFQVRLEYDPEGKLTKNGFDSGEFMICTNPGEAFKPLSKIASGGELSRIMLAAKSVLADIDEMPVLIFDEIDTGISGYAATKVAEKFKSIAASHQVICVSHLAQIAAIADENIFISKEYIGDVVSTKAALLDDEEKIREVSRLLDGGDYSEVTKKHAEALIARMRNV
jgi:DNA repair protein RecN (Recombination protein N)